MHIRPLVAEDRDAIERIARTCGAFTADEEKVCLELIDATLAGSPEYEVVVAAACPAKPDPTGRSREGENVCGFLTYGTDPIGRGVWEVYWIVTDSALRNRGVGSALLAWLHDHVDGRMILIETGGKPAYDAQRRFYEKNGYREVARVRDFYLPGDDLVVFRRDLGDPPAVSEAVQRAGESNLEASTRGRVAETAR